MQLRVSEGASPRSPLPPELRSPSPIPHFGRPIARHPSLPVAHRPSGSLSLFSPHGIDPSHCLTSLLLLHPSSLLYIRHGMEPEGQRGTSNPAAMLASLVRKREKLQDELRHIERQVYDLETSYLQDSNQCGNVLKGFEGFLSSSKNTANLKRSRKFQAEDRLFSLSSVTSPAVEEHVAGRDDGRADYGQGKAKGGGTPANGQGKPKKGGRIAPREGKRIRPSNDLEIDDEDDPDLSLR